MPQTHAIGCRVDNGCLPSCKCDCHPENWGACEKCGTEIRQPLRLCDGCTKSLTIEEAVTRLSLAHRDVLRDYAFGDEEVTWIYEDRVIADGYFSLRSKHVWFKEFDAQFFDGEAEKLRQIGIPHRSYRNDSAEE